MMNKDPETIKLLLKKLVIRKEAKKHLTGKEYQYLVSDTEKIGNMAVLERKYGDYLSDK